MNRRPRLRLAGNLLLIAGGLVLAYPLWSAGYAQVQQTRLDASYQDSSVAFAATTEGNASTAKPDIPESELIRTAALTYTKLLDRGDVVGRLRIPHISLNRLIQQGTAGPSALDPDGDRGLLRRGLVHYAVTPLPGAGEPFAISGHRTTYGAPFYELDRLEPGADIFVETPYAKFHYKVVKTTVVVPTDVSVLLDRGYDLVLTTCTPPYSASHRLVVWAALKSATIRERSASPMH